MATAAAPPEAAPKKSGKMPLILGVVGALVAGGGGFYATYALLPAGAAEDKAMPHDAEAGHGAGALLALAFVPVPPLIVSLGPGSSSRHLRLTAQIEAEPAYVAEVTHLMPRIQDVLNSYLRAVEVAEFEDPAALARVRAHLLRRIQVVTGEGRVRDLLIAEFVLN
jgi:flagellar FliL protein